MEGLLLLTLLAIGGVTYLILRRSVAPLTRTPVWLLWLVVMAPPVIWSGWMLVVGSERPPLLFLLLPFVVSTLLYFWLIQRGRRDANSPASSIAARPQQASLSAERSPAASGSERDAPAPQLLDRDEEARLRHCFPWQVYYLQGIEQQAQAVLCRGKLRATPEVADKTVRENVAQQFGERFWVIFQPGPKNQPLFALVPNARAQAGARAERLVRPGLAGGLLLASAIAATWFGAGLAGVTPQALQQRPTALLQGVPYALALVGVLGAGELSHYGLARAYRLRASLPYFIPFPVVGTVGAFAQLRSPLPHRQALFDVAIAGPLVSLLVALPVLIGGLAASSTVPLSAEASLFRLDALDPRGSLLLTAASKLALGEALGPDWAINLAPVGLAGYIGVVVAVLKLTPVGRLDGGHIVHAMYGQRSAIAIGQVVRLLVLALAFLDPGFLVWAIALLFVPTIDEPALNDVSPLDDKRDALGLLALALLACIVLPAPEALLQAWNL